jgi:peptidoglycan/LPS O-acetylase OafA/YrhL
MQNKTQNLRIDILDGFRGIAILLVLLFHFFSRWKLLYSYGDQYDFFSYGKMGVQLFFIISGFVILYTLENTESLNMFWKKRIIRLFPSMLIASFITFVFFNLFDNLLLFPASHFFKNVLVSITFLPPDSLSSLLKIKTQLDYISGSYWSLWPEIQFYFFVSFIYFLNKNKFPILFFGLSAILIALYFFLPRINGVIINKIKSLLIVFNLIESLPYFCFGVLFYLFFKNKREKKETSTYLKIYLLCLSLFQIYKCHNDYLKFVIVFIFLILFMFLVYCPKRIHFLEHKFLLNIGVSSYFLYLIHENIGVFIIYKYSKFLNPNEFIFPLVLILLFIFMSILYTHTIEKKINIYLKKRILNKKIKEL